MTDKARNLTVEALRQQQQENIAKGLTHGGLEIFPPVPIEPGDIAVDCFGVYVPLGKSAGARLAFYAKGFHDVIVNDGDQDEDVFVGSVDGDKPINLRVAADVLDAMVEAGEPYEYASINAHGNIEEAREYMKARGYFPVEYEVDKNHVVRITGGQVSYENSY